MAQLDDATVRKRTGQSESVAVETSCRWTMRQRKTEYRAWLVADGLRDNPP